MSRIEAFVIAKGRREGGRKRKERRAERKGKEEKERAERKQRRKQRGHSTSQHRSSGGAPSSDSDLESNDNMR